MSGNWHDIEDDLSKIKGRAVRFITRETVSGGCISQAWKATDNRGGQYFIKTHASSLKRMFETEAAGLQELEQSNTIRTPHVFTYGANDELSYLVLEHISLKQSINQMQMGKQLALMHQTTNESLQFGWVHDNYIGSTTQSNQFHKEWTSFWRDERLLYQLNLAKRKGYSTNAYDAGLLLADSLESLFTNYHPKPSLLHGDLWGGNCASDNNDNPVIFDPAIYYGDRETDIAMTELFGGFSNDFYRAYNDHHPLDTDYTIRKILYNLYHILNHYHLFGGGYAKQAEDMTKRLLSEM